MWISLELFSVEIEDEGVEEDEEEAIQAAGGADIESADSGNDSGAGAISVVHTKKHSVSNAAKQKKHNNAGNVDMRVSVEKKVTW